MFPSSHHSPFPFSFPLTVSSIPLFALLWPSSSLPSLPLTLIPRHFFGLNLGESNRPIDVLADRSVPTVSAWFEQRPSIEIVSRDRSSQYAAAISKGAPQALQVADLWHIGKNLSESMQTLLARCRAEIRRGLQTQAGPVQEPEVI